MEKERSPRRQGGTEKGKETSPLRRRERQDCRLFFVECQHGLQQNIRAVLNILRPGELLRRMTDSADAEGMKIIPTGPRRAISCASCPAPLGISLVVKPDDLAVSSMSF